MRRTAGVEDKGRRKRGKHTRQANRAEQEEEGGPGPLREHTEVGFVCGADASAVCRTFQNSLFYPKFNPSFLILL